MHTRLGLRLALGGWLLLAACSSSKDKGDAAGGAAARDGGQSDAAADSGAKGSGDEGADCSSDDACAAGLRCLLADEHNQDLKVCARSCKKAADCKDGERCLTVTGAPEDSLCWHVAKDALEHCGPRFTAMCDDNANLGCLRVEDDGGSVAGGVCLEACDLPGPGDNNPCSNDLKCLDIIGKDGSGVCARTVARGEVCEGLNAEFCASDDLCLSDGDQSRCYQDCTDSGMCDGDKTCKPLKDNQGSYCD